MATVYLARDLRHERLVALKVLRPELAATLGPDRFLREIKLAAQLQHPHILPLHDSGEAAGFLFYVMPYVEGESLRDRLSREKQLPVATAVRIAAEVASALDYAHRHQVIHRDIKPENILLQDGRALVADFGIALAVRTAGETRMTETGLSLGTPQYMSPEQASGARMLDARTDIYALGCVLYEMLTGEPPFAGPTAQAVIAKVITDEPRPPTQLRKRISPQVEAAVLTALQKLPADRFDTASQLAEALARPGEPILPAVGARRPGLRDPRLWAALALAGATLVASAGWLLFRMGGRDRWSNVSFSQKSFRREGILVSRFAPDGQTLVYSATHGSVPRLYIIRPDYPEPQPLGPDSAHLLAISSKGEMAILTGAAYIGHRLCVGTLARMPVGGGGPREIMADVREADWAPDGSELAIIHTVGGKDRIEYPAGNVLYHYSSYLSDVRMSPRGDRIAFFEHPEPNDDQGQVAMVDLSGRRTLLSEKYQALEGLAWTPDGRSLFYSASEGGGFLQIHELDMHGKPHLVLPSAGTLTLQDVAKDGRWLVTRDDRVLRILVKPPDQSEERDLSWLDNSVASVLSGDGRLLLLADESGSGQNYAVMMRRTDGAPVVRLGEGFPWAVSRDQRWVLATVSSTPPRLMLYPIGAGETRRLEVDSFVSFDRGEFFPDGKAVLICGTKLGQAKRCYVSSLERPGVRPVTPEGSSDAVLSPDGRQILARVSSGEYRVFPLDGGESRPVSGTSPADEVARWSSDGRAAFVWRQGELPAHIHRLDLETGRRSPLVTIAAKDRPGLIAIINLSLADDPRVYAYTGVEGSSQLFVVTGVR